MKVRTELAKSSPYYISKNRRLELKYFCLQFKDYKDYIANICLRKGSHEWADPTGEEAIWLYICKKNIEIITESSKIAGGDIWEYLLKAVTEDLSFVQLSCIYDIPCSKDYYYDRYHKFWYVLSQKVHGLI